MKMHSLPIVGKKLKQNYEARVDSVVDLLSQRGFPAQLYFLRDGIGLGVVIRDNDVKHIAAPGVDPDGVINADYPNGVNMLHDVLTRTPFGHVPKGIIRDAVREMWRRKFNALQMEKAAAEQQARDGVDEADNLQTAALLDAVFRGVKK